MANADVDWGGLRSSIIYGPEGNRSKVPIRSIGSVEVQSMSSSEGEEESSKDGGTRGKFSGSGPIGKKKNR